MLDACQIIKELKPQGWTKGKYISLSGRKCAIEFLFYKAIGRPITNWETMTTVRDVLRDNYGISSMEYSAIIIHNDKKETSLKDVKNFVCKVVNMST